MSKVRKDVRKHINHFVVRNPYGSWLWQKFFVPFCGDFRVDLA